HLAGIAQAAVVVVPDEQRAQTVPAPLRLRVSTDHQLLVAYALELQPVRRTAVVIGAVTTLGDDSLPALATGLPVHRLPVLDPVDRESERVGEAKGVPQHVLSGAQAQTGEVVPVTVQQVEHVVEDLDPAGSGPFRVAELESALQPGETGLPPLE